MIINFYGGNLPIDQIRDLTKTDKNGTTAFHIIEACKSIGFNAEGIKTSLEQLNKENLILPCIAHVVIDGKYKHFVVIYKIDFKNKKIIIADPSCSIKKITFSEFQKMWSGVLITLYPLKKLPLTQNISFIDFLLKIIKLHKTFVFNIIMLSIFITIFSVISSFYMKNILDAINYNNLTIIFIFFLFINIFKILSDFFRNKLLIYLNQKIDLLLTLDTYKKIISLPYNYYHTRTTGDIISRVNDLSIIRNMITKVSLSLFIDLPLALVTFIIFYIINTKLFFISLIIVFIYLLLMIFSKNRITNNINTIQVNKSETMSYMIETINGFETVKSVGNEAQIIDKFEKKYVKFLKNIFKFDNYNNTISILKDLVNAIGYLTIIYVGAKMVTLGNLTFGDLLVFVNLLNYFLEPIKNIIDLNSEIKEAKNSLRRILELFKNENKKQTFIDNVKVKEISFNNLSYSYDYKEKQLKNINLKLKKQKILILGKSGSGKSTLFKLLMRYYEIPRNQITINGYDINDYKDDVIKQNFSYISQNEILYTDSIYNNLKIDKNITEEQIIEISKKCFIDEFLNDLGLNMLIEENGYNLSGGQRQRIILARALLKNFEVLIIDEGLSQMDINLERKILKNLFKMYENKMIIVISHRLDNMDLYDRVIELKNGEIVKDVFKNE
jgi:ABC-type bacteriocin transporter